jgi:hypothetical protein
MQEVACLSVSNIAIQPLAKQGRGIHQGIKEENQDHDEKLWVTQEIMVLLR